MAFCITTHLGCTKCPNNLPFLDIKEIEVILDDTQLTANNPLEFTIRYERIQYLSAKGISLVSYHPSALYAATGCEPDGQLGLKHPVTSIDMFANVAWGDNYPAGKTLIDFMEIGIIDETRNLNFIAMQEYISSKPDGFNPEDLRIRLKKGASTNSNIFLSVVVSKSDGSALIKNLPAVSWN